MGNLGEEISDWNEKWIKLPDGSKVRRGWTKDDDGKWRTFADIAANAGKTAEAEAEAKAAEAEANQAAIAGMTL
jgi:hypothetical protein